MLTLLIYFVHLIQLFINGTIFLHCVSFLEDSREKEYISPSNYLHQDSITDEKHEVQNCNEPFTSIAEEFYLMKMKYLKEEHEKKMVILEEEHAYWRDMRSKI